MADVDEMHRRSGTVLKAGDSEGSHEGTKSRKGITQQRLVESGVKPAASPPLLRPEADGLFSGLRGFG
jgi:hypothetical protein